jgi:hypothetical protein
MPDRSGLMAVMATAVAGAIDSPVPQPMSTRPTTESHSGRAVLNASVAVARQVNPSPNSVGRRPPKRAASRPAIGAHPMAGIEKASSSAPVFSGLKSSMFWKYCVITSSVP